MTPKQREFLLVLLANKDGLPPGEIAFRCGYRGRPANHGGAGRAPMWTGRMLLYLPDGLVKRAPNGRLKLTYAGERRAEAIRNEIAGASDSRAPSKAPQG